MQRLTAQNFRHDSRLFRASARARGAGRGCERIGLLILLGIAVLGGCATPVALVRDTGVVPPEIFEGRQAECVPRFPDQSGWYGADAAYSVPLPIENNRVSLWLFGDSFVERTGSSAGRAYPFVHNSIGLSHCSPDGNWEMDHFWQRPDDGPPRAFFVPDPDAPWLPATSVAGNAAAYYWPFDGFIAHDTLFVGLLRVIDSKPRGPFNLPFRLAGMDLARIENYRDPPSAWQIQISSLSNDTTAFPGSAYVETKTHLFAFAFFDRGDGRAPRMLSRIDLESLRHWTPDLSGALETWSSDSRWIEGFEPEQAMILMDDHSSEMSVHFDRAHNRWVAVYAEPSVDPPGQRATDSIQIRTAKKLTGPWSDARPLVEIPETRPSDASSSAVENAEDNLFCYAGKAHPQFAVRGELLVTYVCNLFARDPAESLTVLQRLIDRTDLYRPRAISVPRAD